VSRVPGFVSHCHTAYSVDKKLTSIQAIEMPIDEVLPDLFISGLSSTKRCILDEVPTVLLQYDLLLILFKYSRSTYETRPKIAYFNEITKFNFLKHSLYSN
jgi:hypothetical protein